MRKPLLLVLDFTVIIAEKSNGIPDSETQEVFAQRIAVLPITPLKLIATNYQKSPSSNTEFVSSRAARQGLERQCIASFGR